MSRGCHCKRGDLYSFSHRNGVIDQTQQYCIFAKPLKAHRVHFSAFAVSIQIRRAPLLRISGLRNLFSTPDENLMLTGLNDDLTGPHVQEMRCVRPCIHFRDSYVRGYRPRYSALNKMVLYRRNNQPLTEQPACKISVCPKKIGFTFGLTLYAGYCLVLANTDWDQAKIDLKDKKNSYPWPLQRWAKKWTCIAKQQPGRARQKVLAT